MEQAEAAEAAVVEVEVVENMAAVPIMIVRSSRWIATEAIMMTCQL
jgi:hypothetical protein